MITSILSDIMYTKGYSVYKVERTQCYMRKVYFSAFTTSISENKRNITVEIDERNLYGITDREELEYVYKGEIERTKKYI